jgi:excisionase family DNA binding protein
MKGRQRLNDGKPIHEPIVRGCGKITYDARREWRQMMEDRWLSVDEIAEHLGIKRDTVYRWISERQMPGHKIGRLWKFNKMEVDEWVRGGGTDDKTRQEDTNR